MDLISNSGQLVPKINYYNLSYYIHVILLRPYIYTYDLSFLSYPKAVYIQNNMFSFQDTPGGSLNPKEFWVENCNMNERFLWLNKQDVNIFYYYKEYM